MEFEKLKQIIADVLNVDPEEITMDTTFTDDLGADSLDVFQIVMGIEEEFDIEVPPEKAEKITTVEEVIKIGEYLNVPEKVLYKKPNDGLSNQTDEDKLGVKYSEIATYIEDKTLLDEKLKEKIEKLHNNNLHKFNIPTYKQGSD